MLIVAATLTIATSSIRVVAIHEWLHVDAVGRLVVMERAFVIAEIAGAQIDYARVITACRRGGGSRRRRGRGQTRMRRRLMLMVSHNQSKELEMHPPPRMMRIYIYPCRRAFGMHHVSSWSFASGH